MGWAPSHAITERLHKLVPIPNGGESEPVLGLLVLEDSPFDMGLLESLWDNLDDMLGDVHTYLKWLEKDDHLAQACRMYGDEGMIDPGDVEALKSILEALSG